MILGDVTVMFQGCSGGVPVMLTQSYSSGVAGCYGDDPVMFR